MIVDIHQGDITHSGNKRPIIIGMNTQFAEPSEIGRRVLIGSVLTRELERGDVITFKFDQHRELHMIICHTIGRGGWVHADRFLRFGLDYLWQRDAGGTRRYSIVKIGTGPIGRRDGADPIAIHTAMADSFLPLHLFIRDTKEVAAANVVNLPPLEPFSVWKIDKGELRMAA